MKPLLSLFLLLFATVAIAQQDSLKTASDRDVALAYFIHLADSGNKLSTQEVFIRTALYFLDKPYVASTLEGNEHEQLVVNLRQFDCTTFVETCLALTRAAQSNFPDYDTFCKELQSIRYRKGVIDGYESRLHYISDWITDNSEKGIIEDVSHAIGGKKLFIHLDFMSTHPELYKPWLNDSNQVQNIRKIENRVNTHQHYYFLPKSEIRSKQNLIKDGDIVCFTTSIAGLDVSHLGIAYHQKGVLAFIHASSSAGRVIINPESLEDFCIRSKKNTGIIVLSINAIQKKT